MSGRVSYGRDSSPMGGAIAMAALFFAGILGIFINQEIKATHVSADVVRDQATPVWDARGFTLQKTIITNREYWPVSVTYNLKSKADGRSYVAACDHNKCPKPALAAATPARK